MAEIPSEVRSSEKEQAPQCGVATIEDADICRRQKRPGVLSCAVREAGIPPAVRARILTERKSIARSKGFARPLRLRNCPFCHVPAHHNLNVSQHSAICNFSANSAQNSPPNPTFLAERQTFAPRQPKTFYKI